MGWISLSVRDKLNDLQWGRKAHVPPATIYFALSSTDPYEDGSGATEPVIGLNGYQAKAVANDRGPGTLFPDDSVDGLKASGLDVTFDLAVGGPWLAGVDIEYWTAWDHATDRAPANFLGGGEMPVKKPVTQGDTAYIPASEFTSLMSGGAGSAPPPP
jgi:hypothetical protein